MTLAHLVDRNARRWPDRPALALGRQTYADQATFARRVRALSRHLRHDRGLAPGSRVALVMTNHPAFWEGLFAAWHAGLIAVPINPKLHRREVDFIIEHSGAALSIVTPDLNAGGAVLAVDSADYHRLRAADGDGAGPWPASPGDAAWLFYTSGTTGRPKGAVLSHRALLHMIFAYLADIGPVGPDDAMVHAAPQSHGAGLYGLVPVVQGAVTVVPDSGGFDPAELADLLGVYRGLSLFAAPTMVNRLTASPEFVAAAPGHLNTIIYGGAPMYRADLDRALALFGPCLAQIYGQGEAPMTITALPAADHIDRGHPRHQARLGSVGFARTGVEVRVVDANGTALPPGQAGEVVVRGDVVMSGYWQDPQATAGALRDGWLHTGDVGAFDDDGYLSLLDRNKDVIISGGSNIYPREVEEVLLRHPLVREVSVIGRRHADWGEEVVACVVPQDGASLDTAELDRLCLEQIARFKRPRGYLLLDQLPKNSTGKVVKTELRRRLAAADPDPSP